METTTVTTYGGAIFDFFGVLTFNMVEVISAFEDREKLPRGVFLRAWADPRGQELFHRLELGRISQADWNKGFAALIGVAPDDLMARYLHDAFPAYQMLKVARQRTTLLPPTGWDSLRSWRWTRTWRPLACATCWAYPTCRNSRTAVCEVWAVSFSRSPAGSEPGV